MDDQERRLLELMAAAVERLLLGELPQEIDLSETSCCDETRRACDALNSLIRAFSEAHLFILSLSEGKLDVDAPQRNFLVSPFKQLQSNLRQLTWQTGQITKGDLNQHVDFMGEFSTSFNKMIASLREKREIESALKKSEKKMLDITSALGEGLFLLNQRGELTFMNPEAERLLGWTEAELMGKRLHDIIHSHRRDEMRVPEGLCPVIRTIGSGEAFRVHDDVFTRKDGSLLPVTFVCTPVMEGSEVMGSVTAFYDITELKHSQEALERANRLLEHQATTDTLTGIANRQKFNGAIAAEMSKARRHSVPLSLIMFDIDNFKTINDTYGHKVGDIILRELAALVSASMRPGDIFARWGGEEFVVLLPYADGEGAENLAERLRIKVELNSFSIVGTVTCSFGAAQFRNEDNEDSFLRRTDEALYNAKKKGKNRVELADG